MGKSEIECISMINARALALYCCIVEVDGESTETRAHTFPLLDVPEGELILHETVAINEVGMTMEWEGMERKKGREQMGDTNEV